MMSLVGRHIGRYRILEQLGQGGMSVVYKGLDTALDREVAVKVLHPHLSGKEESRKRLAREAKAVAKLHHPNILEVFDFAAVDSEDAYIVTEYIRGQTLRQWAANQSFDPPELAAMVIHDIAGALAHAHEAGIIHRDLKPENVMVREDGVLKLMDFGIAKIIDRDEKMTLTGALVGSPAHMAPEIIEGEEAGAEADVFSLGTMLYLFATSRLPFTASNTTATLRKILDGVYDDPRQLVPTVSDDLAEIIATCLMRQPSARYPNAGKLRDALSEYLGALGFTRVSEELVSFFADPPSYRKLMVKRLEQALVAQGERYLAEKRPAKALSSLNQVLALDSGNTRALTLLAQMNASRQRAQSNAAWVRLAVGGCIGVAVAAAGYQGYRVYSRVEDPRPSFEIVSPTEVPVPASVYPLPPPLPKAPEIVPEVVAVRPEIVKPAAVKVAKVEVPLAAALAEVEVRIRPWGYLSVDGKPRTATALPLHRLSLTTGKHAFTVTCDACVAAGETREQLVVAGKTNEVLLAAPLKPSGLVFFDFPAEALVTVGADQRTVKDSQARPFQIVPPASGSPSALYQVPWSVSAPGFRVAKGTARVEPGKTEAVRGSLERE
ncbi:MAG: protein kinase domain-containing protein [Myxococcaceae bacterium]